MKKIVLVALGVFVALVILGSLLPDAEQQSSTVTGSTDAKLVAAATAKKPQVLGEKDGFAITAFAWKQRDSTQSFDYEITVTNTEFDDVNKVAMGFELVYEDGTSSGEYRFFLPICDICEKKELVEGEVWTYRGNAFIPRSRIHRTIKEVNLTITDAD